MGAAAVDAEEHGRMAGRPDGLFAMLEPVAVRPSGHPTVLSVTTPCPPPR